MNAYNPRISEVRASIYRTEHNLEILNGEKKSMEDKTREMKDNIEGYRVVKATLTADLALQKASLDRTKQGREQRIGVDRRRLSQNSLLKLDGLIRDFTDRISVTQGKIREQDDNIARATATKDNLTGRSQGVSAQIRIARDQLRRYKEELERLQRRQ
jgi:hypothetical protein